MSILITPSILIMRLDKAWLVFLLHICCRCGPDNDVAIIAATVKLLLVTVVAAAIDCVKVASQNAKLLACEHLKALDYAPRWVEDDVLVPSNGQLSGLQFT